MRRLACSVLLAAVLIVGAGLAACQRSHNAFVAHEPLPPPPSGPLKFAGAWPEHPFHKEPGNVFARTIFQTDGPNGSRIEIRDILIPPRTRSSIAALPGPAVMELATGTAVLRSGEKPDSMVSGALRSLAAGTAVEVENPDADPSILRLYVIRAR